MTDESTWRIHVACLPLHRPLLHSFCHTFSFETAPSINSIISVRPVPGAHSFYLSTTGSPNESKRLIARDPSAIQARYATNGDANWTNLWHFLTNVVAVVPDDGSWIDSRNWDVLHAANYIRKRAIELLVTRLNFVIAILYIYIYTIELTFAKCIKQFNYHREKINIW